MRSRRKALKVIKDFFHFLTQKAGLQVIRASRTDPIRQLTGIRNVLNGEGTLNSAVMERLGHASMAVQLDWLLRQLNIDTVLDVGANTGQFADELRALGYRGQIASFEPMSSCVDTLRRRATNDSNWTIFPVALGRTPASRQLTRFADSTFSSLHSVKPEAAAEFGRLVEPTGSETIEVRTLDEVWEEAVTRRGCSRVLLKSDTQGHDLEVLLGGAKHLRDCVAVLCEASFAPIYTDAPTYHELFAYLESCGFECAGINALSYRADRPALIEANALFVNSALSRRLGVRASDTTSRTP